VAFLHPANIASRNDVPARLQTVAKCLREFLPDEVTVWLERAGDGERDALRRQFEQQRFEGLDEDAEPYLVVLDPEAGIAVLVVPSRITVRYTVGRGRRLHVGQIRKAIRNRVSALRTDLAGRFVEDLPVKAALAIPDASVEQLAGLRADLPVLGPEDFAAQSLRSGLHEIIGGVRRPLSKDERSAARASINPDIVIQGKQGELFAPPTGGDPDDEEILLVMDRKQERLARNLGTGYRLIRGVAGSGKTLVLTYRARYMARHFPHWRILLLCFNKPLSLALGHQVSEHKNIRVRTLDSLALWALNAAGRAPGVDESPDFPRRRRDALEAVRGIDESELFDLVLVDEAQDLDEAGLNLAWAMLKQGRDHFVMALDGAQMIYRRRMAWNPPGRTARGRTTVLDVNYRNTREILDLGLRLLMGIGGGASTGSDPDDLDILVKPERAERGGSPPSCLACADPRGEAETISKRVESLLAEGAQPDNIVVLLGTDDLRHDVTRLVPDAFDTKAGRNRDRIFDVTGRVRIATLGLLKGLEFHHVIVGGANHIWVRSASRETYAEDQKRLLYVAATRATETLTIVYSGEGIMSALDSLPERRAADG
jgi:hypothetical protein